MLPSKSGSLPIIFSFFWGVGGGEVDEGEEELPVCSFYKIPIVFFFQLSDTISDLLHYLSHHFMESIFCSVCSNYR